MPTTGLAIIIAALTIFPLEALADRAPCAPFDKLALERLPQTIDPDSTVRMRDLWDEWSRKAAGTPWPSAAGEASQFRIETSETFVPQPYAYEVRGVRQGGTWSLKARTKRIRHRHDKWGRWVNVAVTTETAARLDRAISDRCLWSSPSYLAATLPLAAGGWVPVFDGPLTYMDVQAKGRRWAGMQTGASERPSGRQLWVGNGPSPRNPRTASSPRIFQLHAGE